MSTVFRLHVWEWVKNKPVIQEFLCCMTRKKMSKNDGNDHKQPDSVLLSCTCIHLGCLPFDRKFQKFRMEGKWWGHFSEITTEKWGACFEVVLAFQLIQTKQNVDYHAINQFLGPFLVPDSCYMSSPFFFSSNRNGWGISTLNW